MKKINLNKIVSILFVISALVFLYAPFQSDSTLGNDSIRMILKVFLYFCAGMCFLISMYMFIKGKKRINKSMLFFLVAFFIYYFFMIFHTSDNGINISGILILITCIGFCLLPDTQQIESFRLLRNIWFIICIISIICYISYSFDLFLPYRNVSYYSLLYYKTDIYIDYGVVYLYKSGDFLRLCGICNEAGFFGTICALILCIDRVNIKNKKNIIILIAGVLSFSFAFFLIIFVYLLIKSWKNWKIFFVILVILTTYTFILPNIQTNNKDVNYLISRFYMTDSGFKGDNRSNKELDYLFESTLRNNCLFGLGSGYIKNNTNITGVSSYKSYIIEYGFVVCLFIWGTLTLSALYKTKNSINTFSFIIVFFLSIYQRPNIMSLPYMMVLFGGLLYINKGKKNKEILSI